MCRPRSRTGRCGTAGPRSGGCGPCTSPRGWRCRALRAHALPAGDLRAPAVRTVVLVLVLLCPAPCWSSSQISRSGDREPRPAGPPTAAPPSGEPVQQAPRSGPPASGRCSWVALAADGRPRWYSRRSGAGARRRRPAATWSGTRAVAVRRPGRPAGAAPGACLVLRPSGRDDRPGRRPGEEHRSSSRRPARPGRHAGRRAARLGARRRLLLGRDPARGADPRHAGRPRVQRSGATYPIVVPTAYRWAAVAAASPSAGHGRRRSHVWRCGGAAEFRRSVAAVDGPTPRGPHRCGAGREGGPRPRRDAIAREWTAARTLTAQAQRVRRLPAGRRPWSSSWSPGPSASCRSGRGCSSAARSVTAANLRSQRVRPRAAVGRPAGLPQPGDPPHRRDPLGPRHVLAAGGAPARAAVLRRARRSRPAAAPAVLPRRSGRRGVLLSCHSQGSVLGAAVLLQVGDAGERADGVPHLRLTAAPGSTAGSSPPTSARTALDRLGGFLRDTDATAGAARRARRDVAVAQPVPAQRPDRRRGVLRTRPPVCRRRAPTPATSTGRCSTPCSRARRATPATPPIRGHSNYFADPAFAWTADALQSGRLPRAVVPEPAASSESARRAERCDRSSLARSISPATCAPPPPAPPAASTAARARRGAGGRRARAPERAPAGPAGCRWRRADSAGRLSSFVPASVSSPRTASRARTRESTSRTGLPAAASIPTATASMSTSSTRTRPGERARTPPFTELMDTREIVVAAPAVTPVVAPTMVPPRMRASGLNERTASFSTPRPRGRAAPHRSFRPSRPLPSRRRSVAGRRR